MQLTVNGAYIVSPCGRVGRLYVMSISGVLPGGKSTGRLYGNGRTNSSLACNGSLVSLLLDVCTFIKFNSGF